MAELLADVDGQRREEVLAGPSFRRAFVGAPLPPLLPACVRCGHYAPRLTFGAGSDCSARTPACHAFKGAVEKVRRILEESIDGLPPESGAHAHRDTYVAAAKLDLAADK